MTGSDKRDRLRFRMQWMEAVLASDLLAAEKNLAIRIALHRNDITGQCNPSEATLAKGIRLTPRYVRALKAKLEQKGWLRHAENGGGARQGKGVSNNYELLPPPGVDGATRLYSSGLVGGADAATRNGSTTNPERQCNQPGTVEPPNTKNNNSNTEKDIYDSDLDIGIEGEVLPPTAEHAARPMEFDEAEGARPTELTDAQLDAEFEKFWEQCTRAVDYGKAKKIYCPIVRDGKATPEQLLHAMMIYAAAREGEDERFTKTPATWLENYCWRDNPEAISPKSPMQKVREALRAAAEMADSRPPPPPDPAAEQRHQEELEQRRKAAHRKNVNYCKDCIRKNDRSDPHWFGDAEYIDGQGNYVVYKEALAELAGECLSEEQATDFRGRLSSATYENRGLKALKTEIEQALALRPRTAAA